MSLTAGTRLGPYEIQSALGAGGMGEVYKARDTRLDRTVAIKVLPAHVASDPESRQRFEREARAVAALNHPHICTLYDIGRQDGIDFLVMEYLEGQTLALRLTTGALPLDYALQYAIQIVDALATAHRAGITHRDLKPGNIMITKAGAKLLDFGLAKWTGPALAGRHDRGGQDVAAQGFSPANVSALPTLSAALTAQGTILGTFQYMAPEQLEGKDADARTDIFAFGALVYEMVTSKKAFEGKNHATLIAAIIGSEPPPISTIQPVAPPALDRVVKTCLAKEPDDRWQTARDLLRELQWIAEIGAAPATAATASRRISRERLYAAIALVFLLTSFGLTAWMLQPDSPPPPVRFSVAAPEGTTIATFAASPDGRLLAFSAAARAQQPMLYVRPLDAIPAHSLPGTEGARSPFWSPDNRFIGFFANGKLKIVDASGGAVRTLCDAQGVRSSGDWNREGVILFGTDIGGAIQRISAEGGQPTAATTVNGPDGHLHPSFLPDGRHFLYFRQNEGVRRASLDSKDDMLVVKTSDWGKYVPPGYLVFVREGDLIAQPFDASRGAPSGEAMTIGNVGVGYSDTRNGFSVAGGLLAFQTLAPIGTELAWFSRSGERVSTVGAQGAYANPQLSPDGARLAVQDRDGQTGKADVWVIDLTRGVRTRATFDPTNGEVPLWSPEGTNIVFKNPAGQTPAGMFRRRASGSGAEEQLLTADRVFPDSYSPDGRYIVYTTINTQTNRDIGVLPLFGDRKPFFYLHSTYNETQGHFSPDGKWMAYSSDESRTTEVYVQTFPAGGPRVRVSTMGGAQARWRRDGRELFYLSPGGHLMAVPIQTTPDLRVGTPSMLFQSSADPQSGLGTNANYDVTADGQRFIVASRLNDADSPPITVVLNWQAALGAREKR